MTTHELLRSQRFLLSRRRRKERGREILAAIRSSWTYGMEFTQEWDSDLGFIFYKRFPRFPAVLYYIYMAIVSSALAASSSFPRPFPYISFPAPPKNSGNCLFTASSYNIPKKSFPVNFCGGIESKEGILAFVGIIACLIFHQTE